ncbi:MAG: hypothetical protein ACRDK2_11905 [Solirubrobacteraceae bacterium]
MTIITNIGRSAHRARLDHSGATLTIGSFALISTATVAVVEIARLRRKPQALLLESTRAELAHTERALLGILGSFAASLGGVRALTHTIHRYGSLGPFRDLTVRRRHIHHFVPGIVLTISAGAVAILSPQRRSVGGLAIPFGLGLALTLDEAALLLDLDDVYWSDEGRISLQIALGVLSVLSTLTLAVRRTDRQPAPPKVETFVDNAGNPRGYPTSRPTATTVSHASMPR